MLVGLTGNIACGKSTVATFLSRQSDFVVFDTDQMAKDIMQESQYRSVMREFFGHNVFNQQQELQFGLISERIFRDHDVLERFEDFVHKLVWQQITIQTSQLSRSVVAVVESAVIYEIGWESRFSKMVVAHCSELEQWRRCREDRQMTTEKIKQRMAIQLATREKVSRADFSIDTECTKAELMIRVAGLAKQLRNLQKEYKE